MDDAYNTIAKEKTLLFSSHSVNGLVRIASTSDMSQLKQLRLAEFLSSNEFQVINAEQVSSDSYDADDINLIICDTKGNIISTTRGVVIQSKAHAYDRFGFMLPLKDADFPALYLSKAATALQYRNQGLNSLLRYYFLSLLPNSDIQSVIGYVYEGAPRMSVLASLGYILHDVTYHQFNDLRTKTKVYLAHLEKIKFNTASQYLKKQHKAMLLSYPWSGKEIKINDSMLTDVA